MQRRGAPTRWPGCTLCEVATDLTTQAIAEVVAYRDETVFALPSPQQRPTNPGHFLVVPASHVADLEQLPTDVHDRLLASVARVARAVRAAFDAAGVSVVQHHEPAGSGPAGAHVYFHAVPRFCGDNFHHCAQGFPHGLTAVPTHEQRYQAEVLRRHLNTELVGAGNVTGRGAHVGW